MVVLFKLELRRGDVGGVTGAEVSVIGEVGETQVGLEEAADGEPVDEGEGVEMVALTVANPAVAEFWHGERW